MWCLLVVQVGCATISQRPANTERRLLGQAISVEVDLDQPPLVEVERSDSEVIVSISPICVRREVRRVEEIHGVEKYNATPGITGWMAGLGAVGLFGGLYTRANAEQLSSNAKTNASPSSSSPPPSTAAYENAGTALAIGGAVALTIALVDIFRASSSKKNATQITERGEPQGQAPCEERHNADAVAEVLALRGKDSVSLGVTEKGRLVVQPSLIPREWVVGDVEEKIQITASYKSGTKTSSPTELKTSLIRGDFEEDTWLSLDLRQCDNTARERDCAPIELFLDEFPGTKRAPKVESALQRYRANRAKEDEVAWANSSWETCRQAKISVDCSGVGDYIARFPKGLHKEEAKRALLWGGASIKAYAQAEMQRLEIEAKARASAELEAEKKAKEEREKACSACVDRKLKDPVFKRMMVSSCSRVFSELEERMACGKVLLIGQCREACLGK